MKRRDLLKRLAGLAGLAAIPAGNAAKEIGPRKPPPMTAIRWECGKLHWECSSETWNYDSAMHLAQTGDYEPPWWPADR